MQFPATWMDLQSIILSREIQMLYIIHIYIFNTWNLKTNTTEPIYKPEMTHRYRKQLQSPKGKEWGRNKGVWDQQIQTTLYKIDKQQRLQQSNKVSTGKYVQYLVISNN